jgi:hypothetical protein
MVATGQAVKCPDEKQQTARRRAGRRRPVPSHLRPQREGLSPFSLSGERTVFLLLRLAFLESASSTELLEHSGLRRVLVLRKRLSGPKAPSARVFAWLCWRNYAGPTTLAWI